MSQAPTRPGPSPSELAQIASAFTAGQAIVAIRPLGSGNVNDTYLVELADERLVLQRLNTGVFREPRLVMRNLQRKADQADAMQNLSQQASRENAGTTSLGALLRAKLDNN